MPPTNTAQLVADCLSGDEQAKALFYIEFRGLVSRAIAQRLSTMGTGSPLHGEIEDIANEVFERLFRNNCSMLLRLHNPSCIHAWLVAVAGNHAVDYIRKLNARGYGNVTSCTESSVRYVCANEEATSSPDRALDRQERVDRLAHCLAALSEQDRMIVDLFYVQGLKYVQIAEILGLNVNTLSAKLRRARLKLRGLLEKGVL
ncbi:MAG: sigma-70 family RNA polymerase sigma factor [Candidatus Hydrogenedentes bacterium]|nr:sigma-70 family RNA polymerase sigma factor [Candidatus Hydrogenedentota bacterium]